MTISSVAFLGSLGHCIGMCGGFVIAYSSSKINTKGSKFYQISCHLFYNFGRVFSYVILGMIFGAIGGIFAFSPFAKGILYFIIGVLMVLMGLSLIGKIRFLTSLEGSLSSSKLTKIIFSKLIKSDKMSSFFGLGVLNGFFPCGLVYYSATFAASTASWFYGGIVMLIFGLFTMPMMLGLGYLVGFLHNGAFREFMVKISSIIIIAYGIYMSYLGYMATQML